MPEDEKQKDQDTAKPEPKPEVPPIEKLHEITLGDETLSYTSTTGMMPLKNAKDEIEARVFFTAYTLNTTETRPLTFVFNGGPGSSSVWLHLGALGPKRVKMQDEGWMPAPPFQMEDNAQTWLDMTDLVFIDPVGTGYSHAEDPEKSKEYWSVEKDIESVGRFIRLYLTRYQRWLSPLFLAGESYGTTRAAGLAGHLFDHGVAFNGIYLISTVLNFQTLLFGRGNDEPYWLYVPTYAATAWYHGRLPDELQEKSLNEVLDEVEEWTSSTYLLALAQGDRLSDEHRDDIVQTLAYYTGISEDYIDRSNLRVNILFFCKELLRDEKRTVGRLDSRFKGTDASAVTQMFEFDPSFAAITPPYTAVMNHYVRADLGYESDRHYAILNFEVNQNWEWDKGKFADTSEALRSAMAKNPFMQVYIGQGYYDLATPHYAALYTFSHMDIAPERQQNIHTAYYEAGHMYYLDVNSLAKLKHDARNVLNAALK